ncbi:isoleucine--tRNA ligase [Roseospira marina]|uniref:Isoleucine--tRNA ligase n=1 Tax=Roseospira marina TaxID=140057 RepID=A0A5M6ID37_9PROT|nr:isoleucine--tRNA ligase [Roseospira marina]KAA5606200.1 isoleucine--tRNA ligase [Roseospira marina]MBB4314347.1 isoleucyl-tRNA synthetase [Roseospira marina]MBB5087507.1 isoleucyl-tRNA synthetase [Roseospira marina]
MSVDYKTTVFLPKTDFPMKAGLAKKEPEILARWQRMDLYRRLRDESKGREKFILHDGPPYANGHLHMGHALNKILKDVIVRGHQMLGKDANYVPGWDCHGLPIEWKIEEGYRKRGQDKDSVDPIEFRKECRDFAQKWVDIQSEEFQRLGVVGDWKTPYTTMAFAAEAQIARELGKFLMNGGLYRGAKPVMWSVVEKTALADAEVEYHDHTSTTIWVRFPVHRAPIAELENTSVVIWTTTPWTMPGNRAIAYGADMDYVVLRVVAAADDSLAVPGERLAVAADLVAQVCTDAGITEHEIAHRFKGRELAETICHHPWHGQGYDFPVPLLPGDFVTTDQGTGFVHIAPGHGEDDYWLGMANGITVPDTVGGDGLYFDHVPMFAGQHVYKVAPAVLDAMKDVGALLAHGSLVHSYPHSWRSKAPLIFRNTPQWFISMETNDLRAKALAAIDATRWVPRTGYNRIRSMIETRPDWCVSRQRAWGVPLPLFLHKASGEPLRDQAVVDRIAAAFEAEGSDVWFHDDAKERFLGSAYSPDDYEKVTDIVEVWFDSGSTHAFVLEARDDLQWPASLYLEGSDQHRGWFHSSLLESCGTRGRAPYEAVLTHGFLLDEKGEDKMSKSKGNVIAPKDVWDDMGADILRLWVVSADYSNDLRFGKSILKQVGESYRRLRNTLRYMLGNLAGFTEAERLPVEDMPELERWVLHRLTEMDAIARQCIQDFDFHTLFQELFQFCGSDLSAFYFDIRKDAIYCDAPDDLRRRAARTVLDILFDHLVRWLAPFISFTADEAWLIRHPGEDETVHTQVFRDVPRTWRNDALAEKWAKVRRLRRVVTGALEKARAAKKIGASLQAHPVVYAPADVVAACEGLDLADLCITSGITLTADGTPPAEAFRLEGDEGVAVVVARAEGEKCQRCWKVLPDVGTHAHEGVCGRCDDVVGRLDTAPA